MQHERLMLSAADLAAERELRPEGAPPPRLSIVHLPEQLTPQLLHLLLELHHAEL